MSFLAQRTPHLNASRSSPYESGHYAEPPQFNVANYYPPAQEAFALEWNMAGTPEFPGGNLDFTTNHSEFSGGNLPGDLIAYDGGASSPESIQSLDTPPSTPGFTERPRRANRRGPDHIPRPRNAFMIFRSELCSSGKISKKVEGDNRHISITAAAVWKAFLEDEKKPYQVMAELEKLEHRRLYPNYRFKPTVRATKPLKRKVQRNSEKDIERSRQVAQLILAGKEGPELEEAVKSLDDGAPPADFIPHIPPPSPAPANNQIRGWVPHNGVPETVDLSPVRNQVVPLGLEQFVPNYSTVLAPGWEYRYTGKPRNPTSSISRRARSPRPHVLVELYANVVDRPMVTTAI